MSSAAAKKDHHSPPAAVDAARLSESQGARVRTLGFAAAGIGILLGAAGFFADREHFLFSYLAGFTFVLSICLTALMYVIIHHLTKAKWSVAARRLWEQLGSALPLMALLFIPIAIGAHTIWHHWMGPEAVHDALLQKKKAYLNVPFFFTRAAVYFAIWSVLSWFYHSRSTAQDQSGDKRLTLKMRLVAPPAILLMGLSLSFAGFDWLMGLDPHWYSTVFGVYVFAGGIQAMFALTMIITIQLQQRGLFKRVSTVEHRHDIGKLLFGFTVFYAYIGFCQYFLIWYANIPEETIFYRHRWEESWKLVSMVLLFSRFILPFMILLSRHPKRHPVGATIGAAIVLFGHYVDHYWLVMPTIDEHAVAFSWVNIAGLAAPLGVLLGWLGYRMSKDPLYPLKDPDLKTTYKNMNL